MKTKRNLFLLSSIIIVLVFGLVYIGVKLTANLGKSSVQVAAENAGERLSELYSDIAVATDKPVKGQ
ncbi:VWA domain-containing protein, partial [Paenibacillus sp. TAF58]